MEDKKLDKLYMVIEVVTKGLIVVAAIIKKSLNKSLIITDLAGKQLYPDEHTGDSNDDMENIPIEASLSHYYYHKVSKTLYYKINCEQSDVFIIIHDLSEKQLEHALETIDDVKLAVRNYFIISRQKKLGKRPYLYLDNPLKFGQLYEILKDYLDEDANYLVQIYYCEKSNGNTAWQEIYECELDYLEKMRHNVFCIGWSRYLLYVVAVEQNNAEKPQRYNMEREFSNLPDNLMVEHKYNCIISNCYGREYPCKDIEKSYREAMITLKLKQLLGQQNFSCRFSDLGMFTFLFCLPPKEVKDFCHKILQPLLEHDLKSGSELFATLKVLTNNDFNWRSSAMELFVHVNTLYNRAKKIEECLGISLSYADGRSSLLMAMKVLETYQALEEYSS